MKTPIIARGFKAGTSFISQLGISAIACGTKKTSGGVADGEQDQQRGGAAEQQ